MLFDYVGILITVVISLLLSIIILGASYLLSEKDKYQEKLSIYECGFDPFQESRSKFNIRYYLVCILFIIFDLEVSFLFPWSITLGQTGTFGFISMLLFLVILTIGFIYEWRKDALDWE